MKSFYGVHLCQNLTDYIEDPEKLSNMRNDQAGR
jgi:hypothetical protein